MSGSIMVNLFLKAYKSLENSYDKSLLNKIIGKIGYMSESSVIVRFLIKNIFTENEKKYSLGSKFIDFIQAVVDFFAKIATLIFKYFDKTSDTSLFASFTLGILEPTKNFGTFLKAIGFLIFGFSLSRLILLTILNGFAKNIILINGILLIGSIILIRTDDENLDNCVKNCLIYKLIHWFFVS